MAHSSLPGHGPLWRELRRIWLALRSARRWLYVTDLRAYRAELRRQQAWNSEGSQLTGSVLNVVAHPDDDLLFLSPDLAGAIRTGVPVTTIFLTSGDGGRASSYWKEREEGIRRAYAVMAGLPNVWQEATVRLNGRSLVTAALVGHRSVCLAFLRLPDGLQSGGSSVAPKTTLQMLYQGEVVSLLAVDGATTYSRQGLIDTIRELASHCQAEEICTQDYLLPEPHPRFGNLVPDHRDHLAAARFAYEAHLAYERPHRLLGYAGYGISSRPRNVYGDEWDAKLAAFSAYAAHDDQVNPSSRDYRTWCAREYRVGSESGWDPALRSQAW